MLRFFVVAGLFVSVRWLKRGNVLKKHKLFWG